MDNLTRRCTGCGTTLGVNWSHETCVFCKAKDDIFGRRARESFLKFYYALTGQVAGRAVDEDEILELIRVLQAEVKEQNEALLEKPVEGAAWDYPVSRRLREERDHYRTKWHETVKELEEQRKKNAELHRRAQRLEGIEAHMETLRTNFKRELGDILHRARWTEDLWYGRYHKAVEAIRAAGVDDSIPGQDNYVTGDLFELLRRLIRSKEDTEQRLRELEISRGET